ncbi:MAG: hypothetical protein M5R40_20115 [Anaerolineae bacterium]|nr:hypothetical protein [Anaerolineae bacterium]
MRQIDRRTLMIGGAVGGVILLALLLVLLGGGGGGGGGGESPPRTTTPAAGAGAPTPTATENLYPTFTPSPTATVVITNTPIRCRRPLEYRAGWSSARGRASTMRRSCPFSTPALTVVAASRWAMQIRRRAGAIPFSRATAPASSTNWA